MPGFLHQFWKSFLVCSIAFCACISALTYRNHVSKKATAVRIQHERIYDFLMARKKDLQSKILFLETGASES